MSLVDFDREKKQLDGNKARLQGKMPDGLRASEPGSVIGFGCFAV